MKKHVPAGTSSILIPLLSTEHHLALERERKEVEQAECSADHSPAPACSAGSQACPEVPIWNSDSIQSQSKSESGAI